MLSSVLDLLINRLIVVSVAEAEEMMHMNSWLHSSNQSHPHNESEALIDLIWIVERIMISSTNVEDAQIYKNQSKASRGDLFYY